MQKHAHALQSNLSNSFPLATHISCLMRGLEEVLFPKTGRGAVAPFSPPPTPKNTPCKRYDGNTHTQWERRR